MKIIEEDIMRMGLLSLVIVVLIVAALVQNVAIGGIGGLLLLVVLLLFLTGRLKIHVFLLSLFNGIIFRAA